MKHDITYIPIGVIYSEHKEPGKTPIQPIYAEQCKGRVEVLPEFADGLADLDTFSHIYLIYHLDRAEEPSMKVNPFLQDVERGLFSTRAPRRPNAIGMSIVRLTQVNDNVLEVEGIDILDGTPLLDIKPYTTRFDCIRTDRNGWHEEVDENDAHARGLRDFKPNS